MSTNPTGMGFELKEKVAALQAAILEQHPKLPILLREIWTTLKQQPENVTLATEEEIRIIFSGLEAQTKTFLAESVTKGAKKPGTVAALKSKGADAF